MRCAAAPIRGECITNGDGRANRAPSGFHSGAMSDGDGPLVGEPDAHRRRLQPAEADGRVKIQPDAGQVGSGRTFGEQRVGVGRHQAFDVQALDARDVR